MSGNGPSEDSLSVAALAVALVALIVALGQVLCNSRGLPKMSTFRDGAMGAENSNAMAMEPISL